MPASAVEFHSPPTPSPAALHSPPSYPSAPEYDFSTGEVGDGTDLNKLSKSLELALDLADLQEELVRIKINEWRREVMRAEEAMRRVQITPLVAGHLVEVVDEKYAVVTSSASPHSYYVTILSTIDRELLKPSANVLLHGESHALVGVLPTDAGSAVSLVADAEKPNVTYDDIGGYDAQKQEVREAIELPLTHPELFARVGVDPPRGVLLYGPPGTGKTMLAKAVAHHTSAGFIQVNGAEFVQKYLGEGPRMMREVFQLARDNAPAIIFIDEVDAIATARFNAATGGDREVHRVLMELLAQMDGFDQSTNVRVIMATNRVDTLDPALLRPGRIDRKVEFPLPDRQQKRLVFQACTAGMSLDDDVDLEELVVRHDEISAAEIAAVCREAGMQAVRDNRYVVTQGDFEKGYRAVAKEPEGGTNEFYFYY